MNNDQLRKLQTKLVDSREPGTIRASLLETGWYQTALICGDYTFFNHEFKKIGIERKTVGDLLTSIGDRLSKQLESCLDYYDESILMIEGSWRTVGEHDNFVSGRGIERSTWKNVWNYLRQFQRKGITLELVVDEGHTIKRVNELYALYQKPFSLSGKSRQFEDDRVLAFPSGCRGKTALDCLAMFKSIEMICKTSITDLMHVPGIGNKKAALIYEHFHKGTDEVIIVNRIKDRLKEKENINIEQGKLFTE